MWLKRNFFPPEHCPHSKLDLLEITDDADGDLHLNYTYSSHALSLSPFCWALVQCCSVLSCVTLSLSLRLTHSSCVCLSSLCMLSWLASVFPVRFNLINPSAQHPTSWICVALTSEVRTTILNHLLIIMRGRSCWDRDVNSKIWDLKFGHLLWESRLRHSYCIVPNLFMNFKDSWGLAGQSKQECS